MSRESALPTLFDRVAGSGVAVLLTLTVGTVVYALWVLVTLQLSLNRQLSGMTQDEMTSARVTSWFQGVVFALGVAFVAWTVKATMAWIGRRGQFQGVPSTSVAIGAAVGVVAGLFVNRNLAVSRWHHLFVDVPEMSRGLFWLWVPVLGMAFALGGATLRRQR